MQWKYKNICRNEYMFKRKFTWGEEEEREGVGQLSLTVSVLLVVKFLSKYGKMITSVKSG